MSGSILKSEFLFAHLKSAAGRTRLFDKLNDTVESVRKEQL